MRRKERQARLYEGEIGKRRWNLTEKRSTKLMKETIVKVNGNSNGNSDSK